MLLAALSGVLLLSATALAGGKPDKGQDAQPPTDQLVVRLTSGSTLDASALAATAGVDLKKVRQLADGSFVLKLGKRQSLADVQSISARLAARSDVSSAEPDEMMVPFATTPNDPMFGQQWDLSAPIAGSYGINLLAAWDALTSPTTIRVGVIDTGYRPHADFASRIIPGYDFITDSQIANDGDGRDSDAADPGDFITSAENASGYFQGCGASNSSWHGTHVSGTIGAISNNGLGVVGISQWVQIQPLRVLGKCGGYTSDIADAIRWAAGLSVSGVPTNSTPDRVVNLSLGGSGSCSSTMQSAINAAVAAGTVVVVAAGNSNANAANYTPASCANVITVAATGNTGSRAYYSNYGSSVEIAAPGGDAQLGKTILSTLNSGATTPGADSYANYQGTSMATPHVVGVAALVLARNPSLTPAQVTSILQSSATAFPSGSSCTTSLCGAGIVNAAAAVLAAGGGSGPTPPGSFGKTSPTNLASISGTSVTLSWGTSSGASTYAYCLDQVNDDACNGSWVSVGSSTSATVNNLAQGAKYYWQVQATNTAGTTDADAGAWRTFSVLPASQLPGAFSKSSPSNGATNVNRSTTLSWGASAGATSYEYCVSTSGSCTTFTSVGSSTSVSVSLSRRQTYYWQVRARNTAGTTLANSGSVWNFRTR